jgi:STE24 endopeptidase
MEHAVDPAGSGTHPTELQESPTGARNPSIQNLPPTQPASSSSSTQEIAKRYSRVKIRIGIAGAVMFLGLTIALLATGATRVVEDLARALVHNDYLALLVFAASLGVLEAIVTVPMRFYSGFHLEHKYALSNQSFGAWAWEGVKGMLLGAVLGAPVLLVFYFFLRGVGNWWWLPVGGALFLFSVILARVAPAIVFPLFYKFTPLEQGGLAQKVVALCQKVGMPVKGVFVFNLSKNTKKANAAFAGLGRSKRIILADTLIANFTDEEIETVVAHELGHFKLKHLWIMLLVGTLNSFLGLYLTAQAYDKSLSWFGFDSIDQLAALPLLALWLGLYSLVTGPLSNMVSRSHERAADRFAVALSRNKEAFVNALRKLAAVNLADMAPHPAVEFLFYSHPSIEKRIGALEDL